MDNELASKQFLSSIQRFPLLAKYLAPSLTKRLKSEHWYENRIIRYVLRGSAWVDGLETTYREAKLDSVLNSEEIFAYLQGTEPDYDEKLFDALAEVRLVRWARSQRYEAIEKLMKDPSHPTPDFLMKGDAKTVIAEAKHFRVKDYLAYFVEDRLEGLTLKLALKTGKLSNFGLEIKRGDKYEEERDAILKYRTQWVTKARAELSETWFASLVRDLEKNPLTESNILDGIFAVRRSKTAGRGRVDLSLIGILDPIETAKQCLSRLKDQLMEKLKQIKTFMDARQISATQAIVFFSGMDQSEPEWDELWSTLEAEGEQWAWDCVDSIRSAAGVLIKIPFELIVSRRKVKAGEQAGVVTYGSVEYVPFPWKPEDIRSQ